jgi:hypothetical protein
MGTRTMRAAQRLGQIPTFPYRQILSRHRHAVQHDDMGGADRAKRATAALSIALPSAHTIFQRRETTIVGRSRAPSDILHEMPSEMLQRGIRRVVPVKNADLSNG